MVNKKKFYYHITPCLKIFIVCDTFWLQLLVLIYGIIVDGEVFKGDREALNGDEEALVCDGNALKGDEEAVRGDA